MPERIMIDMIRLRESMVNNPDQDLPEGLFNESSNSDGLKTIRELAIFRFTCRKCEESPCIAVCPTEALEKDKDGVINRHTNLCVSCKSCVTICPFGTMMTDFFVHHRNKDLLYNLNDERETQKFIEACPDGIAYLTDEDESPERNIYRLNDRILIKEYLYKTEIK